MRSIIDEIKNRLLPSKIISTKVALKPRGNQEFIGLCPFHQEKNPSFSVADDKGFYHCFGCGAHGDIFKFIMDTQSLNYHDALKILASEAGVVIPKKSTKLIEIEQKNIVYEKIFELTTTYYQEQLFSSNGLQAREYLKKRGLNEDSITKFRLGFAPLENSILLNKLKSSFSEEDIIASTVFQKNSNNHIYSFFRERIIFPIFNRRNKIIAFGGRILNAGQPKYLNSPDNPLFKKSHELYSLNLAIPNLQLDRQIIIVEGYMDVISLFQAGFKNVVAPLGTALKASQVEIIWNLQALPILCFDNDSAGQKATIKTCKEILPYISSDKTIKIMQVFNAKDPDEFLQKNGSNPFKYLVDNSLSLSDYLFFYEKTYKLLKTPEQKSGLKKRLLFIVDQIKDLDLKAQYKKYFLDKFNQLIYQKKGVEQTLRGELAINSTMTNDTSNIESILGILTLYPTLLTKTKVLDELTRIEILSKELDIMRNYLLSIADNVSLVNNITFPDELKRIISKIEGVSGIKNANDALHYLRRLFTLNTLNKLQYEMQVILMELNNHPTESTFALFINLKNTEEQLKTELGII